MNHEEFNPLSPFPEDHEVPASEPPPPTYSEEAAAAAGVPGDVGAVADHDGAEGVEGAADAPAAEDKSDEKVDEWSQRFEALSKKDREIRQKEQAIAQAEQQLNAIKNWQEQLRKDPAQALADVGLSVDDLIRSHLSRPEPKPEDRIEQMQQQYEQRMAQVQQQMEQMRLQQQGQQWESEFQPLLSDPQYEAVNKWEDGPQLVRQHVVNHYKQTGELLTPRAALDTFNSEIKRRVSAFAPAAPEPAAVERQQNSPKTLNSNFTGSAGGASMRPESDEELMAAIAAKYARGG